MSYKELEQFGNVNLRVNKSVRNSLVQDGGALKPIRGPAAKSLISVSESVSSRRDLRLKN